MKQSHDDDALEFERESEKTERKVTFYNAVLWLIVVAVVLRFALKFDFPEFVVRILEVIE